MKRRAFLERAVVGAAATTLAGPAIAQTGAPVRWRLATSWPKSLDTVYGTVEAMSQRVGQLTDRKFDIQVFAGGEIVPPLQVWDATQTGTVECGHTLTSFYIGKNPAVAFDSGVAFGLNTRQQQAWMYSGGGLDLMRGIMKKDGILPIPCGNVGVQMGGFYRKGLQIRGWPQRLDFLNRGQQWVADRLAAALPRLDGSARRRLEEMHRSHLENIRLCEVTA